MKEDIFDNIIKQKLDDIASKPAGDDVWAVFESSKPKFSVDETTDDKVFDEVIRSNIQKIIPTFKSEHWQLMITRLRISEERRNTVLIAKFMEFAAIFLIIFTFTNWTAWMENQSKNAVDATQYAASTLPSSNISNPPVSAPNSNYIKSNADLPTAVLTSTHINQQLFHPSITESSTVFNDFSMAIATDESSNIHEVSNENIGNLNLTTSSFDTDISPALVIADLQQKERQKIHTEFVEAEVEAQNQSNILHPIAAAELSPLYTEYANSFPMKLNTLASKPQYAISVFGSGDINLINTPFDKLYSRASYNKEALNNSYGMNISKKTDHFEIETGLGYSKREYHPDIFSEEFGQKENSYSEISLNKISFDIAVVPLNFKYHFINQSAWGAYIMAGAALNLVMNADYDINKIEVLGRPAPGRFVPEENRLAEKPFINGILSGESIKENYFASIGFGFGIEKKVFNNTSFYIQPQYQRQILSADIGIGPNKDKIHTSSIQFGIKTILN